MSITAIVGYLNARHICGLDIGEKKDKVVWSVPDGAGGWTITREPGGREAGSSALRQLPRGTIIGLEKWPYASNPTLRAEFAEAMTEMGHRAQYYKPHNIRSRRRDWYPKVKKTLENQVDDIDSVVLCRVVDENILSYSTKLPELKRRKDQNPLMLLRDAHPRYDVTNALVLEAMPNLPEYVATAMASEPPPSAFELGAAKYAGRGKKKRAAWVTSADPLIKKGTYHLLTPLVEVGKLIDAQLKGGPKASYRKLYDELFTGGTLAFSNIMHFSVGRKPYERRKVLLRHWNEFAHWMLNTLTGALHETGVPDAIHPQRAGT
jgi:hypothetical protein